MEKLRLEEALTRLRMHDVHLTALSIDQPLDLAAARALSAAISSSASLCELDIFGGLYPIAAPECCALCEVTRRLLSLSLSLSLFLSLSPCTLRQGCTYVCLAIA